jgi:ABC-type oligopeptide transport system ATPase subunit
VTATALLQVEDLKVHFPGRGGGAPVLKALDGVSLTVAAGEIVGVVGESGCGKTTLGRAIVGLARPTAGVIRFDGEVLDAPGGCRSSSRTRLPA